MAGLICEDDPYVIGYQLEELSRPRVVIGRWSLFFRSRTALEATQGFFTREQSKRIIQEKSSTTTRIKATPVFQLPSD